MSATTAERDDIHVVVIEPSQGWVFPKLAEAWHRRELLYFLTLRDVKVRYAQTALGAFWSIFQPLGMMLVFTFAFRTLGRVQAEHVAYPIYVFAGLTYWTFFSRAVLAGSDSLVANAPLLTKTAAPRLLMPLSAVTSALFDFTITFGVLIVFAAIYGHYPTWRLAFVVPVLLLGVLLASGVSMLLSAINVRWRDVRNALPLFIQFVLFMSPVAYALTSLNRPWRTLFDVNPLVGIIEAFRWTVLVTPQPSLPALLLAIIIPLVALVAGLAVFSRVERVFADLA